MAKGEDQDYPPAQDQRPAAEQMPEAARAQEPANGPQPELELEDEITLSPPGGEPRALTYRTGQVVGNDYILDELLGRGGMGVVFAARHRFIDQKYAIKILAPELLTERNWLRFQREAQSLAKLNHESIVRIFNMGIDKESCPYYVMEFLKGETLADRLHRLGPMSVEEALDCFIAIASALQLAHKQQIIHRDIKPSNIILVSNPESRAGRYKLVDFGLARVLTDSNNRLISLSSERDRQSLTEVGEVFGSPYYMSPEQCRGESLDQRTDIYSFGCSFYEALTGKVPLKGATVLQTFMMHQSMDPEPLNAAYPSGQFSADLELAVSRMLAKNAASRYQDVEAVLHDFQRLRSGKTLIPLGVSTNVIEPVQFPAGVDDTDRYIPALDADSKSIFTTLSVRLALLLVVGLGLIYAFLTRHPVSNLQSSAPKTVLPKISTGAMNIGSMPNLELQAREPITRRAGRGDLIYLTIPKGYRSLQFRDGRGEFVDFEYGVATEVHAPLTIYFSLLRDAPDFLQYFSDADVSSLDIENFNYESNLSSMRNKMRGWKQLRSFCFRNSCLNKSTVNWLSEYATLSSLEIQHSRISASSLVGAKLMSQFRYLRLSNLVEAEARKVPFQTDILLSDLGRATNLVQFELERVPLSEAGLKAICRHRSINRLKVSSHQWTVAELRMLELAKQIRFIELEYVDLGQAEMQYMLSLRPSVGSRDARFIVSDFPGQSRKERPEDEFKRHFRADPPRHDPSF
ncbi:MAG: serine/threonine-protein kinase [Candidatus Obscuribacter sp.]|nr:serine/threonine-protein kinase [Candidatus Obscuribacter sp.]